MIEIIPALLCESQEEFKKKVRAIESFAPFAQIDVLDGSWLGDARSWADADLIAELSSPLHYELHLMVQDPIEKLEHWTSVPAVKRVIFHIETATQPKQLIEAIRFHGWEAGIAVNPETSLDDVLEFAPYVDEIMFMTVTPGASGRPFNPAALEKIEQLRMLHTHLVIGVDGAITADTIPACVHAGATRLAINSALFSADVSAADAWQHLNTVAQSA